MSFRYDFLTLKSYSLFLQIIVIMYCIWYQAKIEIDIFVILICNPFLSSSFRPMKIAATMISSITHLAMLIHNIATDDRLLLRNGCYYVMDIRWFTSFKFNFLWNLFILYNRNKYNRNKLKNKLSDVNKYLHFLISKQIALRIGNCSFSQIIF